MTNKYNNVYIEDVYTIGGIYESNGPLSKYIDKVYDKDMYFGCDTWEKAETKIQIESMDNVLKNNRLKDSDVDLLIGGDLQNQICATNYMARCYDIPYLGIYNACATSGEGIIIGSSYIDSNSINRCLVVTSSHNMVSEKQFRNPTEYGSPRKKISTFTVTGACSIMLSNKKSKIRIESSTIGRVIDKGIRDVNNMGACMAPSSCDTLYRHLKDTKRDSDYYDLILTGDLGKYGKEIFINYMKEVYDISVGSNYNDTGTMIYDIEKQPVYAGGSGPVCSPLSVFSYVYKEMLKGKYKRVLVIPTGALFSSTRVNEKESIPCVSHAYSLEVV